MDSLVPTAGSQMAAEQGAALAGSNSKYTPAVVRTIEAALAIGNTRRGAAEAAGVSRTTLWEWMRDPTRMTFGYRMVQEAGPDGGMVTKQVAMPVIPFREMITLAEAAGRYRLIADIAGVARGGAVKSRRTYTKRDGTVVEEVEYALPQWTAAAWLLERKWPEEWAAKKREEDFSDLTDQELLDALAANNAGGDDAGAALDEASTRTPRA